jgi:hypothetical protein
MTIRGPLCFTYILPDTQVRFWSQSGVQFLPTPTAPFSQEDWPLPQPVTWYREWIEQGNALSTPVVAAFSQDDWPTPIQPVYPIQLRNWRQNLVLTTLLGQDKLPFNQDYWPIPISPFSPVGGRARDLRTWIWPGGQRYLVGKDLLPNNQDDWPVPPRVFWYRELNEPGNALTTVVVTGAPFSQSNWPIPPGMPPAAMMAAQNNLLQTTLVPPFLMGQAML